MEAKVLYYTMMGETKNAAIAVAAGLGCEAVALYNMKPSDIEKIKERNLIVVGCGSYFGMPPERALEFVDMLPQGNGRKAAVFCVGWIWIGPAMDILAKRLKERGYAVIAKKVKRRLFTSIRRDDPGLVKFGRELKESA